MKLEEYIRDNRLLYRTWWDYDTGEMVVELFSRDEGNDAVWVGRGVSIRAAHARAVARYKSRAKG